MAGTAYALRGTEEYSDNDQKDQHILQSMREIYNNTASITQARWVQQSIDERFYAGDQSLWQEVYSSIPATRRKQFNFNKIRRIINMISGYQRKNRKNLNVVPQENSDQETSDQYSKLLIWVNNNANAMQILSDAFQGSLITGMNLLHCWMDYREDPFSGDMKLDNLAYNGYLIDPYFQKHDLSDCNYIWTRKFLSKKQVCSLMPDREEEIKAMTSYGTRDGYFNFLPENYAMNQKHLLPYDEYYYLDYRDATIIFDPRSEETIEWTGEEKNLKYFMQANPDLKKKKIQKQTCKLAIAVNNRIFYNGKNPFKIDKYPFVPVLAYYQPELPYYESRIQGVTRSLRDAQFIMNRQQQIILDVLESQVNSGLKVMEDSLVDDRDAFKSGQGQVMFIKKDAPMGMDSVQKIMPAEVSASMFNVVEAMNKNLMDISGVNEELLGSAEDDKAGILSMLRQGAGLTSLQILFDNLDSAMKNLGRLEIDLIQANFTPSKIKRIIEQEPSQEFYNKTFGKYDCQVVEGLDTPTQRMTALKQALYLREIGVPVPTSFLVEMTTMQNKSGLLKSIKEEEEGKAKMQQMQQQVEMKELEARANLANARAQADMGLYYERTSRVEDNQALAMERRAAAVKDLEMASLDKIKAAKELMGIDLGHLKNFVEIVEKIQMMEQQKADSYEGMQKSSGSQGAPQEGQQNMGQAIA